MSIIREFDQDDKAFFVNQKYKILMNPFQEIFMYKKVLIVAHGNIMSYYNLTKNKWLKHYRFQEDGVNLNSRDPNQSFQHAVNKKVLRMFRYEHEDGDGDDELSIGLLFQDGSLKRILCNFSEHGSNIEFK